MRVLITGATGYLGRAIGSALHAQGHELAVLSRHARQASSRLPFPCESYSWNPDKEQLDPAALKRVEAVIHLAGEDIAAEYWSASRKKKIRDSRVLGTRLLAGALIRQHGRKPGIFLAGSATGYYGSRGSEALDEDSAPGSGFLAETCREWEAESAPLEAAGWRVAKLRTGVVLGKSGRFLERLLPVFRLGLGAPLGDGSQWLSWIHEEDWVCLALTALGDERYRGPVNFAAPEPVTNRDFTRTLNALLGKRDFPLAVPGWALKLRYGAMADALLLTGQRVLPKKALSLGFAFRHPGLKEALHASLA